MVTRAAALPRVLHTSTLRGACHGGYTGLDWRWRNAGYKAVFGVAYGAGLRVSEVVALKVSEA
jgi:hypothetical protein